MKLFLQVGLTHWQQNKIGNLFLNYAASLSSDMMGTDIDSQSEPIIADMVNRLIDQSSEIFLFVLAADSNLPLGVANRIFTNLCSSAEKVKQVVLCGEHRTAESVLKTFHTRFKLEKDPEKIKKLILDFAVEH